MMTEKKREKPSRIPVRFVEPQENPATAADDAPPPTFDEFVMPEEDITITIVDDEAHRSPPSSDPLAHDEDHFDAELPPSQQNGDAVVMETPRAAMPQIESALAPETVAAAASVVATAVSAAPASIASTTPAEDGDQANATEAELRAVTARLERVQVELGMVDAEKQTLHERLTRVVADFENYRKRTDREKNNTYNNVVCEVVHQLLPVHDNLQRALEAEASVQATESEEFRHFLNGVELIYRQLDDLLKGMGLQPIETVGRPFDPHIHEAVATEQTSDHKPDTVIQEIARGYQIGEKLLRPAMVKVSTK